MATKKQLKQLSQAELNNIIGEHFFYIKWDSTKKADLSYIDFNWHSLAWKDLQWANLEWSDFTNIIGPSLSAVNFENANLRWANLLWVYFHDANLRWAILIWAKFTPEYLSEKQKNEAIFTEEQLKAHETIIKDLNIQQKETIKEKNVVIENIWNIRTNELQKEFINLKNNYWDEERRWLAVSITIFIILIMFTLIPISLYIWLIWAEKIIFSFVILVILLIYSFIIAVSDTYRPNKSFFDKIDVFIENNSLIKVFTSLVFSWWIYYLYTNLKFDKAIEVDYKVLLPFLPFEIICLTFLYFCIYQFSKAKNLRIEQQNKIAIISWYQALIAQEELTWKEVRMNHFLPNIADVLFCKANEKNDQSLPFDKALEIAKLVKDTTK